MELQMIDYIFWGFIALVVIGGVGCLIVFLPKEHELEERTADCYRIVYRDGNYSISPHKANYGENVYSLRSKFFYIKKVPFHSEAFCDEVTGCDGKSYRVYMIAFDRFCNKQGITEPVFTARDASAWLEQRDSESHTTHYSRVNASKLFLSYLSIKGYDVYVVRDVKYKGTGFQPHIYTNDETIRYFWAVDNYSNTVNRKDALQYPILFRILYINLVAPIQ